MMDDKDLQRYFNAPLSFDDETAFAQKLTDKLRRRVYFRRASLWVSGVLGGIYALAQIVRVPSVEVKARSALIGDYGKIYEVTDNGLEELLIWIKTLLLGLADRIGAGVTLMQSPSFFWAVFALCLAFLTVMWVQSNEELI